nr:alkaline shock response membrane anchor protein AmaP [Desulforamulus aquiferis]
MAKSKFPGPANFAAGIYGRTIPFWPTLLWVSVTRQQSGKAVVHDYMLGQVKISLQAIENLVKKVVYQVHGVKDVKPRVIQSTGGIGLHIKAVVAPDISIPEVSREIQHRVQEYLAETTGITVTTIKIYVENISSTRPRVE